MSSSPPTISIVVPVYGCDDVLRLLHERLCVALETVVPSFELILVDDCGPGRAWQVISELCRQDPRVLGIRLSRNHGQHYAITAGVDYCRGDWLVVMDCDLQDRPEEIPRFWDKAREGYDVVVGRRMERQDSWAKRVGSRLFHRVFSYMTDQESDATQANFGIYSRKVVEQLKRLPEHSRCFPLLVRWLGFRAATIDIRHDKRAAGKTSYTLRRLLSLAVDIIVSYSNKPLKLFIQGGFFMALAAFLYGIALVLRYFMYGRAVQGWTSVMVSLYFLSGLLLLGMGTLGVYIGRIFNQVKGRPLYVVDQIFHNEQPAPPETDGD